MPMKFPSFRSQREPGTAERIRLLARGFAYYHAGVLSEFRMHGGLFGS